MRRPVLHPFKFSGASETAGSADDLGGPVRPERVGARHPQVGLFLVIAVLFAANLLFLESVSLPLPYLGGDQAILGGGGGLSEAVGTEAEPLKTMAPLATSDGSTTVARSPGMGATNPREPVVRVSVVPVPEIQPPAPRAPSPTSVAVKMVPTPLHPVQGPSGTPPPPAPPSPHPQAPVYRLRDIIVGFDGLVRREDAALVLSVQQWRKLGELLPAIRGNFEGPPGQVDSALEARTWEVLTEAQAQAVRTYLAGLASPADCMESLRSLEQRAAVKASP